MRTTGEPRRIPMVYKDWVEVPAPFRKFVWSTLEGKVPLEDLFVKVLTYGRFEDIRELFRRYPRETRDVMERYADLRRGVRYWVRRWSREGS